MSVKRGLQSKNHPQHTLQPKRATKAPYASTTYTLKISSWIHERVETQGSMVYDFVPFLRASSNFFDLSWLPRFFAIVFSRYVLFHPYSTARAIKLKLETLRPCLPSGLLMSPYFFNDSCTDPCLTYSLLNLLQSWHSTIDATQPARLQFARHIHNRDLLRRRYYVYWCKEVAFISWHLWLATIFRLLASVLCICTRISVRSFVF